jgi:hypothetical protein
LVNQLRTGEMQYMMDAVLNRKRKPDFGIHKVIDNIYPALGSNCRRRRHEHMKEKRTGGEWKC